jgi:hypothetical protein
LAASTPEEPPLVGGLASYHGGSLSLQGGLFLGQFLLDETEEEEEPQVKPTDDPTICSDDLFHFAREESEEGEPLATPRIYMMTEDTCEMSGFLRRVAKCRNVTGSNVESWVTAVKAKLDDIGVTTVPMAVGEVYHINTKLARAGHVRMFTHTLDLIVRVGVEDMRDGTANEMFPFLSAVAAAKNLTGQNIRTWVSQVHAKLQVLDITTVKATVSWIYTLNSELRHAGLNPMHRQTLDLMARIGVETLQSPELLSSNNRVTAAPTPEAAPSGPEPKLAPPDTAPKMGQCLACDGLGPVQTLCITCIDGGLSYEPTGESIESTESKPGAEPEESTTLAPNQNLGPEDNGRCSECNGPGTIGTACPDCAEDDGMFLNFHAGL